MILLKPLTHRILFVSGAHTIYKIRDDRKNKLIYAAIKEVDGACAAFLKFWCMRKYHIMRIGFTILVFNARTKDTKLLTLRRKTHWHADQLDVSFNCDTKIPDCVPANMNS